MHHTIPTISPHDFLSLFLVSREEKNCAPVTIRNYARAAGSFLASPAIPENLADIEPKHVLLWLSGLRTAGMSASNRAWHQRHAFAFLGWLYKTDIIARDPRRGIDRIMVPDIKRPQVVEADMIKLLTAAAARIKLDGEPVLHYYRNIAIIRMLWATGLRRRELCDLEYADLDIEARTITVQQGKGMKRRQNPFDVATKRALLEYILHERGKAEGSLFGVSQNALRMTLRALNVKAGVSVTPHQFRRGFARRTRRAGLDIAEVASLMGHSDLQMTRVYSGEGEQEAAFEAYRRLIG